MMEHKMSDSSAEFVSSDTCNPMQSDRHDGLGDSAGMNAQGLGTPCCLAPCVVPPRGARDRASSSDWPGMEPPPLGDAARRVLERRPRESILTDCGGRVGLMTRAAASRWI